ncbi:hypothetical protein V8C37DRAFT_396447 [Trichoderma ceciliae]
MSSSSADLNSSGFLFFSFFSFFFSFFSFFRRAFSVSSAASLTLDFLMGRFSVRLSSPSARRCLVAAMENE